MNSFNVRRSELLQSTIKMLQMIVSAMAYYSLPHCCSCKVTCSLQQKPYGVNASRLRDRPFIGSDGSDDLRNFRFILIDYGTTFLVSRILWTRIGLTNRSADGPEVVLVALN